MQETTTTIKNDVFKLPEGKQLQKVFRAKVVEEKNVAQGVKIITFKVTEPFSFLPWQYVWVEIPQLKVADRKGNRRAFSIFNTINDQNTIQILVRISESGYNKSLFALVPGDEVIIHGPFGCSFIVDETHQPQNIAMIAGGVGIAVFLPMLKTIRNNKWPINCYLVYLNTSPESTPLLTELEELKKGWDAFDYQVKYEHFSWNDVLDFNGKIAGTSEWWITGSKPMVNFVFTELEKGGISRSNMVFENYYPTTKDNLTVEQVNQQLIGDNIFANGLQYSSSHTVITDAEGIILFANSAAERITGYSVEEMLGNTPRLWGGMMSREFYTELWKNKLLGKHFEGEIINRRKNGEIYYAIGHISPIFGPGKDIIGFIATEEDISELKKIQYDLQRAQLTSINILEDLKAEKIQLAQGKARDDAILTGVGDGIVAVDVVGRVLMINTAALKMLGYSSEDLLGQEYLEIIKALDSNNQEISKEKRALTRSLQANQSLDENMIYIRKDGTKFIAQVSNRPLVIEGKIFGSVIVFRDVTREKEVDRMKTEFISLASHQLRTPLSAMKWFSEMLLAGDAGQVNAEQKEYIQNISDSNERMINLVNSLLNISRIESGRIIIEPKPTDIKKLIEQVVSEIRIKSNVKKQQIIVSVHPEIPLINLDPDLVREVYVNLLTNASKYTPDGGEITVFVSVKDDQLVSQVSDSGYGILEKEKDRIFSKFFRGENIIKVETDGTGLGLYLVKAIIDSSGGKIWFESIPAKGTTFWFSLPMTGMKKKAGEVSLNK